VPIASITKLMTAMVVLDGGLDLDEKITLSRDDAVQMKGSRSRLRTGPHALAPRAAAARADVVRKPRRRRRSARAIPAASKAFVDAMNAKPRCST
jgi:D-alanyl-D-alanine endopeptidase (penicillin-binding protein 7)